MAQIGGSGFESGVLPAWTTFHTPTIRSDQRRTGTYSVQCTASQGQRFSHPTPLSEVYMGVGVSPSALGSLYGHTFLGALNTDNNIVFGVGFENDGSILTAMLTVPGDYDYTVLGYGPSLELNTWHFIEVRARIADAPGGICQVLLNGVEVINFTGDTLRIARGDQLVSFGYGKVCATSSNPMRSGVAGRYDDFTVNDTTGGVNNGHVGRGGYWWIPVTGAGAQVQCAPSAGANWQCVDEVPPNNDADYVSTGTPDQIDTHALTLPAGISGSVVSATWSARARTLEAGGGNIAPVLRIGGANRVSGVQGLDTSYRNVTQVYDTNPVTGLPWTLEQIASIELGYQSIG